MSDSNTSSDAEPNALDDPRPKNYKEYMKGLKKRVNTKLKIEFLKLFKGIRDMHQSKSTGMDQEEVAHQSF